MQCKFYHFLILIMNKLIILFHEFCVRKLIYFKVLFIGDVQSILNLKHFYTYFFVSISKLYQYNVVNTYVVIKKQQEIVYRSFRLIVTYLFVLFQTTVVFLQFNLCPLPLCCSRHQLRLQLSYFTLGHR